MFDAILFVQLGSPENATPQSVEKYLLEFLGDRHTLGNPPFFWNWLLRHIIAPKRSVKSAEKYQSMQEAAGLGEMPLVYYTRKFVEGISAEIGPQISVRYAFEFGTKPTIFDSLQEFKKLGKKCIRVVPLFPQRSLVTTVAVYDLVTEAFQKFPQLKMQFVNGFAQNPVWLEEMFNLVQCAWDKVRPIVFSFHGIPASWAAHGDPYSKDCEVSFEWFKKKLLEISPDAKIFHSYQSRFGHGKWLGPSTSTVVESLGREQQNVLLVCPSFTADNLESLFEIDVELKEVFKNAGGKDFARVPCLNANLDWVKRFAGEVVRENLENVN